MHTKRSIQLRSIVFLIFIAFTTSIYVHDVVNGALIHEPEDSELKLGETQYIDDEEIPPDGSKVFSYYLDSALKYHVFLSGSWVEDINETDRTDYDLYVYNPLGVEEVSRTEAAALPEHLGSSLQDPFFSPEMDGLYSLMIVNDAVESEGAQNATLMAIEHLEINQWYRDKLRMRGKDSFGEDTFFTTWAYEFVTSKQLIKILVEVPESLDMYEMRLFLMANLEDGVGFEISGIPVPPSSYLLGSYEEGSPYGGFNLNSTGYRGADFASAYDFDVDMVIEYNSTSEAEKLYYLVFIAEEGVGTIDFIISTDLASPELYVVDSIDEGSASEYSEVKAYANDNESSIDKVVLSYSVDDWVTSEDKFMAPRDQNIFTTNIPEQASGTLVQWTITAFDVAGNQASIEGNYSIKMVSEISISVSPEEVVGNVPISVSGTISPAIQDQEITLQYISDTTQLNNTIVTNDDGEYSDQFIPEASGTWEVQAHWSGGDEFFAAEDSAYFTVEKTTSSLMIFTETEKVSVGEDITISGTVSPQAGGAQIVLMINYPEGSLSKQSSTNAVGEFIKILTPDTAGTWEVTAEWAGSPLLESSTSNTITFTVTRKGLSIYLIGGGIGIVVIAAIVTFIVIRRRRGGTDSTEDEEDYLFE